MFTLHPDIQKDTFAIGSYPLSMVLLVNDQRFPWIMLVPRRAHIVELTDLSSTDLHQFIQEMYLSLKIMQEINQADKMNIGALGNRVQQFHFHIVARFFNDEAWPHPVWGFQQFRPYAENAFDLLEHYKDTFAKNSNEFTPVV
jgi:diadenosine tetraphosphate (Ap4A) HIT family hydrolase